MDFTCIVGEPCAISLVGVELEIDDAVTLHRARFRRTSTCADGVVRWGWGDRLAQPAPVPLELESGTYGRSLGKV